MESTSNAVEMHNLYRTFDENTGVFDLHMELPEGAIFGLIGPSGCGKTTTVRLVAGLYKPESGTLRVLGQEPQRFSMRTRERIGYMPQQFVLYPNLNVRENIEFVASLYGLSRAERRHRIPMLLELVELADATKRLGTQLSGGMKRRLELACALVHNPMLLLADEPTAGIDPLLRGKFWDHFRHLRDEGRTLLVTTQYVGEAAYCDLVGVMREGQLLYIDTPEGLRKRALGGEVVRLTVPLQQIHSAMHMIWQAPFVTDVRRSRTPGKIDIVVPHAAEALPDLIRYLDDQPSVTVEQIEEYQPPFDDIFMMLIEQEQEREQ
ncbi:MAG: ABC transporter ATP-binding protein [Chloroflexota bacterium]